TIELSNDDDIVIVDDDDSIHQIWKGRYQSMMLDSTRTRVFHFYNRTQFEGWIEKNRFCKPLYLIDYELLGSPETGLDIIQANGLQERVVLVTSRYEESSICERCEKLKIKLLPKDMASFVPIKFIYE
ncbi:MAG: hypothetical protein WCG27_05660, partial [Pseudomonadota bacterium]